MYGLVYKGPEKMSWQQVPLREPEQGQVKVAIKAVGICGSDIEGYLGKTGRRIPPMIMGHEMAGQVVQTGEGVDSTWQGKRVVIFPVMACGECKYCQKGLTNLCQQRKLFGTFQINGGMANEIVVPVENLLPLDENISYEEGALVEPLSVALRAVEQSQIEPGETVAIIGAGAIGLFSLLWAKLKGARQVIMIDLVQEKLEMAKELGADIIINPFKKDPVEEIRTITGRDGVDLCIEAAGTKKSVQSSIAITGPGGKITLVGMGEQYIELDVFAIIAKEITIFSSFNYNIEDFKQSLQEIAIGELKIKPIISSREPLNKGEEVFQKLVTEQAGKNIKAILIN